MVHGEGTKVGTFDMHFGIEQRTRRVEMEEHFIKESKKVWKFAADAARITDESIGSEDRKHTTTDVFVAIDRSLGALIDKENGSVRSIPGNERRIAQSWVNVRGGIRVVVSLGMVNRPKRVKRYQPRM